MAENLAIGSEPGTVELHRRVLFPGNTSLLPEKVEGVEISKSLDAETTLDNYFAEVDRPIDLIKVDVEGFEFPC